MALISRHLWPIAIVRVFVLGLVFATGSVTIAYFQWIGNKVFKNDPFKRSLLIEATKVQFVVLLSTISSWISPCQIQVTYDTTTLPLGNRFSLDGNGMLSSILSPNSVIISNHQIYTDWLYLWYITYTARLGHTVHIILKDLSRIPVLGYGMKNFNFLFLSRKWESDKPVLTSQLRGIDANAKGKGPANGVQFNLNALTDEGKPITKDIFPYLIILFPEGTVIARHTKKRSDDYCAKKGMEPMKHVLVPRIRGLFLILKNLKDTVEVVYDFTTGYSGIKEGVFGEDEYSLKRFYILGKGPKKISYYVRAFSLKDIPLGEDVDDVDDVSDHDMKKFEDWVFNVWYEKNTLMDNFSKYGHFHDPNDKVAASLAQQNTVTAEFKTRSIFEFLVIFTPLFTTLLILRLIWVSIRAYLA